MFDGPGETGRVIEEDDDGRQAVLLRVPFEQVREELLGGESVGEVDTGEFLGQTVP
ncbi:hypothetical protein SVIOM74S_01514 [Streptomyces violarus]